MKILASSPITSWQIDGETREIVRNFIFLGSQITADGDCSHEIKTLVPWKKSYDKPRQCIKKQRHYFTNKGPYSQSYGFSSSHVRMWELDHKEGSTLKNWCFWTARRSNQSILKEINPEYSLEGLLLKLSSNNLATWWEEPTHWKRFWCWGRLKAKEKEWQKMR